MERASTGISGLPFQNKPTCSRGSKIRRMIKRPPIEAALLRFRCDPDFKNRLPGFVRNLDLPVGIIQLQSLGNAPRHIGERTSGLFFGRAVVFTVKTVARSKLAALDNCE